MLLEDFLNSKDVGEVGKQLVAMAKQDLRDLLGYDDLYFIYQAYHYEKTVEFYDLAISTHTSGRGFYRFIEDLYYLDDDFNDDIVHFNIALERYRINSGKTHKARKELIDKQLNENYLYQYKTYVEEQRIR